jgi:hypothetical protein
MVAVRNFFRDVLSKRIRNSETDASLSRQESDKILYQLASERRNFKIRVKKCPA